MNTTSWAQIQLPVHQTTAGIHACYSWRGIFLQEPVWRLKQALGLLNDLRQWCTALCHRASLPVFWHCQLLYHSASSPSSSREFEQSLHIHLAHAWQQTLLEEIPWGRMLGQCLDTLWPTILTPSWPPLVPLSPWRKEAPHHKSSLWIYSGKCWPLPSVSQHKSCFYWATPKCRSDPGWKLSGLICSTSFAQLSYSFIFQFL